jgi:hypothetical protein
VTVLQRVPVDRISIEARRVQLGRVLLTLLAGVFYLLGWSVAKLFGALVWCAVAVKVGWSEGRKVQHEPAG